VELLVRYVTGRYSDEDASSPADEKVRASISSSSDVTHTSNTRPLKEDIAKGGAVPISQLIPDASNAKLFYGTEENTPSPVRTHPPSYPVSTVSTETPTVSSLPSSSPLVGDADPDVLVSVGPRANSELGHYPDLVDQRAAFKVKPTSPDQKRKENRRSIIPLKTAAIPERSSSPDQDVALTTPRADQSSKVKISGPIGGTPLPAGFKFGKDIPPEQPTPPSDRREKAKSRMFWGFGGRYNSESFYCKSLRQTLIMNALNS
jgi:RalA-binding protein 1